MTWKRKIITSAREQPTSYDLGDSTAHTYCLWPSRVGRHKPDLARAAAKQWRHWLPRKVRHLATSDPERRTPNPVFFLQLLFCSSFLPVLLSWFVFNRFKLLEIETIETDLGFFGLMSTSSGSDKKRCRTEKLWGETFFLFWQKDESARKQATLPWEAGTAAVSELRPLARKKGRRWSLAEFSRPKGNKIWLL